MFDPSVEGTWAGEGATFFSLASIPDHTTVAIADVLTFTTSNEEQALHQVTDFLRQHNLSAGAIDFLLTGKNGDVKHDAFFEYLITTYFTTSSVGVYKHLCGEYTTSTAFATALAYKILQEQQVPETILQYTRATTLQNVLIYNTYQQHHSLILLTT